MKKYKNDLEQVDAAWKKLEPLLVEEAGPVRKLYFDRKLFAAAASLVVILTTALIFFNLRSQPVVVRTAYGQTSKITLPDSSVVFLNGNSQLTYEKNAFRQSERRVKLEGEGYFSVVHTKSDQTFIVQIDGSSIEVLGTEFNVSSRKNNARIVLSSGKIKFNINDDTSFKRKSIIMRPGEMVDFKTSSKMYSKKNVDPEIYSSWKSRKLIFDNTELREIMTNIQQTYGLNVQISDPDLLDRKVSGSAPSKDLKTLISGLSQIFDLKLTLTGDTLIVGNKPIIN